MPVVSTHCFANHRGGVGKSTLTYQVSAAYAVAHPDHNILVIDATETGDVSEMLLGGVYEQRGRDTLRCLVPIANTTQLFLRALSASADNHLNMMQASTYNKSSALTKVMQDMHTEPVVENGQQVDEVHMGIDLEGFAIPLIHVNSRIPGNLFLCPSGLDIDQPIPFSDSQKKDIVSILNSSFRQTKGNWKIFIDSDAVLPHGRRDVYTKLSLCISDFVCLPLHADMMDWYRVSSLLQDLQNLRSSGEARVKIQMVLWNGLTVKFNRRCNFDSLGTPNKCAFTPTKAEQDVLQCLNSLVFKEAQRYPELFVHYNSSETDERDFGVRCSFCVRNFSVVGVASKDIGVPIVCIYGGTFHGLHMDYILNENTISRCRKNLEELVNAIHGSNDLVSSKTLTAQEQHRNVDELKLHPNVAPKIWKVADALKPTRNEKRRPPKALTLGLTRISKSLKPRKTVEQKIHNTRFKYPLRDKTRRYRYPLTHKSKDGFYVLQFQASSLDKI
eukprot:c27868_g1_i1 orf=187-1689(-)